MIFGVRYSILCVDIRYWSCIRELEWYLTIVFNIRYSAFNIRNIYTYSRYAHSINAKMGYCTSEECTWYQVYIHRSQLIDRTAAGSLELLVGNSAVVQQVSYSVPDIRCAVFIFDIRYSIFDIGIRCSIFYIRCSTIDVYYLILVVDVRKKSWN